MCYWQGKDTALHSACRYGHSDVAEELIRHGASVATIGVC
jgi:ankyrin repeat protein